MALQGTSQTQPKILLDGQSCLGGSARRLLCLFKRVCEFFCLGLLVESGFRVPVGGAGGDAVRVCHA